MTPDDPVEVDPARMDEIVTQAEYLIARRGGGEWKLINRYDYVNYDERASLAESTIVIPTGPDERRELFDAIRMIEDAITDGGDAVHTDLRTVEPTVCAAAPATNRPVGAAARDPTVTVAFATTTRSAKQTSGARTRTTSSGRTAAGRTLSSRLRAEMNST